MKSLDKGKLLKALFHSAFYRVGIQVFSLISNVILIRLLSPDIFGQYILPLIIYQLILLFSNLGLSEKIVKDGDEMSQTIFSSIFWFQLFLALVGAGVLFIAYLFFGSFVYLFFIIELLIVILYQVPESILQKDLRFSDYFKITGLSIFISSTIAIILAWYGFGLYSLILKGISSATISCIFLYTAVKWRPLFKFSRPAIKEGLDYGLPLSLSKALHFGVRNIDDYLIGNVIGKGSLGLYNRAYALTLRFVSQIGGIVNTIYFPMMSKMQDERSKVAHLVFNSQRLASVIVFPFLSILLIFSPEIVSKFLGLQWVEIAPLIQIFCVLGYFQLWATLIGSTWIALGETKLELKISIYTKTLMIAVIALTVILTRNVVYVAYSYAISSILLFFVEQFYVSKILTFNFQKSLLNLKSVVLCTLLHILTLIGIRFFFLGYVNGSYFLIILLLSTLVYILILKLCYSRVLVELTYWLKILVKGDKGTVI